MSSKESFWTKLLLSVFATAAIAVGGFVVSGLIALSGGLKFYTPLALAVTAGLAIYLILIIFNLLSPRIRSLALISFIGLCLLTTAGYEIRKAYIGSFAVVGEQEVDLGVYAPFKPESKTAVLSEPSTYQIQDDLPRLDGATALYPLYSAFVQAVYPAAEYNPYSPEDSPVICSTTAYAYKRLIAGETDMVFAAAPSESLLKEAEHSGVELKLTPIGREAFVFFVNKKNAVNGMTTAQITDIYSGSITNWKEVGGSNHKIRAFQRPEDSGSQTMLRKVMKDAPLMAPPQEDIANAMDGIIRQTADYRNYNNALGYSFLFYASEMNKSGEIKLLEIDGVAPSKDSIRSGKYPFAAEFYAVTAGSSNPNVQPFLDWILSPQGQELVEKTGYTAVQY